MEEKKFTYEALVKDIRTALDAGREAERKSLHDDGGDCGTCNFDNPYVYVPQGLDVERAIAMLKISGIRAYVYDGDAIIISVETSCQGWGRTTNAENASRKLEELGYHSGVRYVMD